MKVEVVVPSPGESISQVLLSKWLVKDGDYVEKDDEIAEIDSEKATLSIYATENGVVNIIVNEGETVNVGATVCFIDTSQVNKNPQTEKENVAEKTVVPEKNIDKKDEVKEISDDSKVHITPLARKIMQEKNLAEDYVIDKYKNSRIYRNDIENISTQKQYSKTISREVDRKKMTPLRIKLSERLVAVKNQTAMLTTFNEVNMSKLIELKKQYSEEFKAKYGVGIGFMSFFTKAVTLALKDYPNVQAMIDGEELIFPDFCDISIAVSAPKGLVVPVIRNAESLSLAEIELKIKEMANKARENKITLEEMTGGTFTITNGGVFGSLLSTPIINPPQSAILGMHNIVERPIAVNGEVKIQPMMYIALSYDHRVIDGRESVGFLVKVKEYIENPIKMLFESKDPFKILLDL
jgi:2-oxoglutarate dehydrogenase E2 component (dihydrolipoamide succinyltransferase)